MTRKQKAAKLARRRDAQAKHRGKVRIEDHGRSKIEVPAGPQPSKSWHRTDPREHGEELRKRERIVSFCATIGFDPSPTQIDLMRDLMAQGRLTEERIISLALGTATQKDHARTTIVRNFPPGTFDVDSVRPDQSSAPHAPRVHADEVEVFDAATMRELERFGKEHRSKTMSSLDTIAKVQEDGRTLYVDPEGEPEMTHEELEQDAWDTAAYEQRMGWPTPAQWAELEAAAKRRRRGARGYVRVMEDAGFTLGKSEDPKDRKSWVKL